MVDTMDTDVEIIQHQAPKEKPKRTRAKAVRSTTSCTECQRRKQKVRYRDIVLLRHPSTLYWLADNLSCSVTSSSPAPIASGASLSLFVNMDQRGEPPTLLCLKLYISGLLLTYRLASGPGPSGLAVAFRIQIVRHLW